MKIVILDDKIIKGDYELSKKNTIEISESDDTTYGNDWHTYREINSNLEDKRGQLYSLVMV